MRRLLGVLLLGACTDAEPITQAPPVVARVVNAHEVHITASLPFDVCPKDMVEVQGYYCPLVKETCLKCLDKGKDGPPPWRRPCVRCAEFAPSVCKSSKRRPLHFCMDRFEWPNQEGSKPQLDMSWYQARDACQSVGKRLCTEAEWTFACEGESLQPYPYGTGLERDASACNSEKKWLNPFTYLPGSRKPSGTKPVAEVDQSAPSGSYPRCVSPFGVFDLTANADEWVRNEWVRKETDRRVSLLKGGHWVKGARNRCRPLTRVHPPHDHLYVTGTRCCSDPGDYNGSVERARNREEAPKRP